MTPGQSAQAQRILASAARRGANLIREAAYVALATRALEGDGWSQGELFDARHRFTPGWSGRRLLAWGRELFWDAPQPAQDGPWRGWAHAAVLQAADQETGR